MRKNQQDNIEPAKTLAETAGRQRPGQARSDAGVASPRTVLAFLSISILLIGTVGVLYLQSVTAAARKVATDNLAAVAESKVREIVNWRAKRLSDGNVLQESSFLAEAVARYLANPGATNNEPLLTQFRSWQTHQHYRDILLADTTGQVRLSLSGWRDRVHEEAATTLAAALRDRSVVLTDLHIGPGDLPPHMDVVVPLPASNVAVTEPRSAIILQVDAGGFLFPLIQAWPTASPSAETLLIRQEGNDVLYLNELRHRTGTALTLRLPIVDKNLPAARAVRGETGEMAGVDYRGVPVLAHVRAVPGTKWFMVAKVDAAEINAPLRQQTLLIGVSLGLLLLVIGLGAGLFWRQQRVRHYREKEDAVRASEVRYRRLFEAARDGVLILDAETGMVVDVNPYLIELLGVTREVFLGKKVWELGFFKDIVANEANFAELKEKQYIRYEDMAMEGHDGKRHEVEFVSNVYLVNHQKVIQCNIRDISERVRVAAALRESEDNYRLLFREMQNGFALHEIICDEAGNPSDYRFLAVNPAFERMTGLKAAETVGRTVLEILPDTERSWIEHYGKVALTGEPVCFENYAASMKKHFEVVAFRPTINQFACVFSDITERKQAEAMVQRVAQELQHKNAELERFLYTASHDLKSPVVTVRTFLGYLEQDMPTGDAGRIAKDMEFIRAATDKIAQLLDDVLEMSRIGRVVVPPVTVTLRALVDDALGAVAGRIAERGVTMQVNDGDAALHGDRVRLAEVFQNLLDNACKFMGDQKEPRIEVGTMRNAECGLQIAEFGKVAENGSSQSAIRNPKSEIATSEIAMSEILNPTSEIVFFVRDNGIGIDPRHQAKVFDLFEKLDPKAEGTGIGLALVKRIVGLHGGRVWVESAGFGQGTCFYFTLPGTRGGTEGRDQKSEVGGDTP